MARHTLIAIGVAVVALGTLTACGGGNSNNAQPPAVTVTQTSGPQPSTGTSPTSSKTPTSTEQPDSVKSNGTSRCSAATLKGDVQNGDAAAGNRYAKLVVTNTGKAACTLYGYGGLALANATGTDMPTKLTRTLDPKPTLVTLQPGQKATKNLHWGAVPDGTESTSGPCEPESAGLNVIPPDETQPFAVKANLGSVCEHGTVDGSAYYK
ncbi:DUF4232 domain-containing protein [Actinocrispum wychmicini]|uniref:Uncharacterized protein DUF4232 n=1 Tax=Actinocrispum wychmicini TaxID=1213861 RepID=A0A4R2JM95_9PSEU|nr:DUF4232 domain-containing protein [Actinocrispum wychmicini]TCO58208.1 uncharacterized protein DUF4232 [Actinocrispum wychmicini]